MALLFAGAARYYLGLAEDMIGELASRYAQQRPALHAGSPPPCAAKPEGHAPGDLERLLQEAIYVP